MHKVIQKNDPRRKKPEREEGRRAPARGQCSEAEGGVTLLTRNGIIPQSADSLSHEQPCKGERRPLGIELGQNFGGSLRSLTEKALLVSGGQMQRWESPSQGGPPPYTWNRARTIPRFGGTESFGLKGKMERGSWRSWEAYPEEVRDRQTSWRLDRLPLKGARG